MSSEACHHVHTIAILGVGLLGGSLAMAVRRFMPEYRIRLWARREQTLSQAFSLGLANSASTNARRVVKGADLVVLCTPVSTFPGIVNSFLPALAQEAIVTDVGSVKQPVHESIGNLLSEAGHLFIGSHPMAGAEKQGLSHARANLFQGATTALTNPHRVPDAHLLRLARFWEMLGCRTLLMSPEQHDATVARVSHLPHVLAALCARSAMEGPIAPNDLAALASSGFRDTTRICLGGAELWADILLSNRNAVLDAVKDCERDLDSLRSIIDNGNRDELTAWLERARLNRSDILPRG